MNLVEFAKKEFLTIGYKPVNEESDGPNKWMQENVLELLEVFSNQGHSGSSASYAISCFSKLARYEPLSPIECSDDEWNEVGTDVFQNNRLSSVFKNREDGKPYFLDAIVWKEDTGISFIGTVEGIESRQYIKLPFVPKTFYIDVIMRDGKYFIKDKTQLKEVWDYYCLQEDEA